MKLDLNGIRFRFWMIFFAFAVGITLLIGVLQLGLIRPYYRNSKIQAVSTVADTLQENLIARNNTESIAEALKQAVDNEVCVVIYSEAGRKIYEADSLGSGCIFMLSKEEQEASGFDLEAVLSSVDNETVTFSENLTNVRTGQEMIVYERKIREDLSDYYLLVNSALEPVDSIVSMFTRQYMIYMGIAIAAAILVSTWISGKITGPIVRIRKEAAKLEKADYDVSFEGGSFTETRELAETLNSAAGKLSKIDELRRDLLANVSHDIRTPLTDIRAYAEMIQDISGDDPEKRNKHLDVIIRETEYMNFLVNDMSELSQMQSGNYTPNFENTDIVQIIRDVIDLEEQSILSSGVIVETELPETLTVYADEIKISQVIANYLSNAIKHTEEGKKIIIRAFLKDDEETVRVEVQDEGTGIPADELPYIWDRYQKSSRSFSRKLTNTGLGLAIVKAIADSHHAGYGVISEYGKGSTFWIELRYPDEI